MRPGGRVGRDRNSRQFRGVGRTAISLRDPRPDQRGKLKLIWRLHPLGIQPPPFRRGGPAVSQPWAGLSQ